MFLNAARLRISDLIYTGSCDILAEGRLKDNAETSKRGQLKRTNANPRIQACGEKNGLKLERPQRRVLRCDQQLAGKGTLGRPTPQSFLGGKFRHIRIVVLLRNVRQH